MSNKCLCMDQFLPKEEAPKEECLEFLGDSTVKNFFFLKKKKMSECFRQKKNQKKKIFKSRISWKF
jgi:hypothetical protein